MGRDSFFAMATKDARMLATGEMSVSASFQRIDTGETFSVNAVIADDADPIVGIMDSGMENEDKTGTIFFDLAEISALLATRQGNIPKAGDKITQTIGSTSTVWVVKTEPRFDGVGGIFVAVKSEKCRAKAGAGTRKQ